MDVYRALNIDVPQLLFTVLHQAGPAVSGEDYTRTATALHKEIRRQAQLMGGELHSWLQQQYSSQAEETTQKLQRMGVLGEHADIQRVREALALDYSRLGSRIGSESVLGMQGSAEEAFSEEAPTDPDLARRFADGRDYLASLGFKPGQGVLHEAWLLFRGSLHYDVMEHAVRDRMGIYVGAHGDHLENVGRVSFGTYDLIYALGESLTADLADEAVAQEVTLAFNKGPVQYSPFRQEVSAMMEHVAGQMPHLLHASFWQRKLGLGTGKEFVLHLRLPVDEDALREVIALMADSGRVGKETVMKRGQMLLGKRVL